MSESRPNASNHLRCLETQTLKSRRPYSLSLSPSQTTTPAHTLSFRCAQHTRYRPSKQIQTNNIRSCGDQQIHRTMKAMGLSQMCARRRPSALIVCLMRHTPPLLTCVKWCATYSLSLRGFDRPTTSEQQRMRTRAAKRRKDGQGEARVVAREQEKATRLPACCTAARHGRDSLGRLRLKRPPEQHGGIKRLEGKGVSKSSNRGDPPRPTLHWPLALSLEA